MSGATSGASAARSVDRSTSMYASTMASDCDHTVVQRAAAALLLEPDHPDVVEFGGEFGGDPRACRRCWRCRRW